MNAEERDRVRQMLERRDILLSMLKSLKTTIVSSNPPPTKVTSPAWTYQRGLLYYGDEYSDRGWELCYNIFNKFDRNNDGYWSFFDFCGNSPNSVVVSRNISL